MSRRQVLIIAGILIAGGAAGGLVGLVLRPLNQASAPAVREGSPSWSPDGSRIVFFAERDGRGDLWVMDADGANASRLTRTRADEGYPMFSPDGHTIAFDSDRDGGFDIWAMAADGSNSRRLTRHDARDVAASWSPDGLRIAFMSDRSGAFEVWVMEADGMNAERLTTTGSSWFPVYSPNGSQLAFHVDRDVHTMPATGGPLRRLTTDPANGMHPSWSPDGRRIAFMSWRNGRTEIFVMNADGSDQSVLVSMPSGDAIDPRWSPDGAAMVFVHLPAGMQGETRAIWRVDADGSNPRRLSPETPR
ncbi:MAG: hypothetical protein L0271_08750 [Gemmatimonadetes bacterium]|nr:hypothetical protein [Gemmatimonadota bacterium]